MNMNDLRSDALVDITRKGVVHKTATLTVVGKDIISGPVKSVETVASGMTSGATAALTYAVVTGTAVLLTAAAKAAVGLAGAGVRVTTKLGTFRKSSKNEEGVE